jgi:ATP-dependent DNA helicase RecG
MIIDVDEKWSADFIQWVVRAVESSNVEFKRVSGKMVAKALETICAFANTGGGWLVLGVEDAGQSSGMAASWVFRKIPRQSMSCYAS